MRVAIYSRKSKFTGKGESIENQIEMCKEYAIKNLNTSDFTIYEDEGFSGGNTNRPKFQELLQDVKKKKFDVLMCYKLDRISRNVADFSATLNLLQKSEIEFVSIKEQFDTSTPMGRAMVYIASVFAQLERETIAERIRDNMHELAKTGRWLGGNTPFGFKSDVVNYTDKNLKNRKLMKLVAIDEEINLVNNIYEMYLKKGSLSKVHKELFVNDIKTKNDCEWNVKKLQLLLRNPVYVKSNKEVFDYLQSKGVTLYGEPNGNGILTYNKKDSKDNYKDESEWIFAVSKHPGVIDPDKWLQVQRILDENKSKAPRLVSGGGHGLLTSVLRCSHCGGRMFPKQGHVSVKTGELLRYYVCRNKYVSGGEKCKCKNVRIDVIEPLIIQELYRKTSDKETILKDITEYKKQLLSSNNNNNTTVKKLKSELAKKETQVSNLVEQLSLSPEVTQFIVPKIEELGKDITAIKKEIDNLSNTDENNKNTMKSIDLFTDMLLNFPKLFENATFEDKRNIINTLIESIYFDSDTFIAEINMFYSIKKKSLFNVPSIQERNR